MRRSHPFLAAVALIATLLALPASAAFHLFTINEAYSNASGTLQYVELTALAGGQQFTQGHTLVSSAPGQPTRTFNLSASLPGDTAGRRMLFGTAGLQVAFGVTPDYVIPDGFLHAGAGTISWAEGSDSWSHPALPADGVSSLDRSGATGAATPQNFAGVVGSIAQAIPQTFQALWYASPAESEAGWGVNIAHQGDILFATWFTYDTDGSGMWLVMSNGNKVANGVYSGPLYRTTGPAFSSVPFNSGNVVVTPVGSATFTFSAPGAGTFAYTVNGVSQSKAITRQVYASPVSTCTAGGDPGATRNYQDLWYRAPAESEAGWGVNITHQADTLFVTWFTYGADGKGMWLVMSNAERSGGETFAGTIYRTRGNAFNSVPWNVNSIVVTPVGTGSFTFSDANNGTFSYVVDGIAQTKAITRQLFDSPVSVCRTR